MQDTASKQDPLSSPTILGNSQSMPAANNDSTFSNQPAAPVSNSLNNPLSQTINSPTTPTPQQPSSFSNFPSNTQPMASEPQTNTALPTTDTTVSASPPPSQGDNPPPSDTVVTSSHVPQKYGGGKVIATIFGVLLIAGAVVAGVSLVQQRQLLEQDASSGQECSLAGSNKCILLDNPGNQGSFDASKSIQFVDITDQDSTRFYPGTVDDGCYKVTIQNNFISWQKYGSGSDCKDVSNVQVWLGENPTSTPIVTLSPTPGTSTTLTPTSPPGTATVTPIVSSTLTPTLPPNVSASCSAVTAYDTSWNPLNAQELSELSTGTTVYFAATGTASSGTFDKARFTINGQLQAETTSKKPGTTSTFYEEYQIPAGVVSFTVGAQIHHSDLGWF